MSFFKTIASTVLGGENSLGAKIVNTIAGQFPEKLSEGNRAQIEAAVTQATRGHEVQLLNIAHEGDVEFNDRIKAMEGTAGDLQRFGFIGKFLIFLRGAQRPAWGYGVLYLDFQVFSGQWSLAQNTSPGGMLTLEGAFWVVNFLVLGFLFGERTVKNVLPLIQAKFGRGPSTNPASGAPSG